MKEESEKGPKGHRRKRVPPTKQYKMSLTETQIALLRKWGRGDVSAGLRWLIDAAAPLILRKSEMDAALEECDRTELNEKSSS